MASRELWPGRFEHPSTIAVRGQFPITPFHSPYISQRADMLLHMPLDTVFSTLDSYIAVLADSARRTRQAEDRSRYRDHLAQAAVLFHLLHGSDLAGAKELVGQEQRSYGNGFLAGQEGDAAESAFSSFAAFIKGL